MGNDTNKEFHSAPDCRLRLPAFGCYYFGFFLYTIIHTSLESAPAFKLALIDAFDKVSPGTNVFICKIVLSLFAFGIIMHLIRLYISLELADSDKNFYKEFLEELKPWKRYLEFFLFRMAMISLISLEPIVFNIEKVNDLAKFLFCVYASLIAWDIFMRIARGKWEKKFFWPDLTGIILSLIIFILSWNAKIEKDYALLLLFFVFCAAGSFGYFVGRDFWHNWQYYLAHFKERWYWFKNNAIVGS